MRGSREMTTTTAIFGAAPAIAGQARAPGPRIPGPAHPGRKSIGALAGMLRSAMRRAEAII